MIYENSVAHLFIYNNPAHVYGTIPPFFPQRHSITICTTINKTGKLVYGFVSSSSVLASQAYLVLIAFGRLATMYRFWKD